MWDYLRKIVTVSHTKAQPTGPATKNPIGMYMPQRDKFFMMLVVETVVCWVKHSEKSCDDTQHRDNERSHEQGIKEPPT